MTRETKSGITVADFRKDYLFGLPSVLRKQDAWSDDYLFNKIRAAEDELERSLNCYYTPKRIVCEPGPLLVQGVDYDIAEPAYDYETDFFEGPRWGEIRLRHYPIHTAPLPTFRFGYPNASNTLFTVPDSWIRLNGPFGRLRLVPAQSTVLMTFNGYVLSMLYGGRGIPQTIFINYTAGFTGVDEKEDLKNDYNDLLELTKRMAVLNMIEDVFMPSSMTNSSDGMSQSFSYEVKSFRTSYETKLEKFRDKIKGIRLTVV